VLTFLAYFAYGLLCFLNSIVSLPLPKRISEMKKIALLLSIFVLCTVTTAIAVPANKTITFDQSKMGPVVFSGKIHKDAGFKCKDCHNKELFPKMKKGTVEIKMKEIYAGKLCGKCHNGETAFAAKKSCKRCHVKK